MSDNSKKHNEIESEVYDEFLSTELCEHQEPKRSYLLSIKDIYHAKNGIL